MHRLNICYTKRSKAPPDAGFSLIEIIIVLAVMGILAMVVVPNVMQWLPNQRCKAAARQMYSDFQNAKVIAIKTRTNCAITFNQPIGGVTYDYVIYTDQNGNSQYDAGETVNTMFLLSGYPGVRFDPNPSNAGGPIAPTSCGGVTFPGVTFPCNAGLPTTAFQPSSLATAGGAVYLINDQGLDYNINIINSGNVSIDNLDKP